MSNNETIAATSLTDNKKRTLAGLALRKYYEKGNREKQLLTSLWSGTNYSHIFNLSGGKALSNDVTVLKMLIADFGGHFTDLWTDSEALKIAGYSLHGQEYDAHQKRLESISGYGDIDIESLLDLARQIKDGETPGETRHDSMTEKLLELAGKAKVYRDLDLAYTKQCNDPDLTSVLELRDLAEFKQTGIYSNDTEPETVENDAHFDDGQQDDLADSELLEADYQNDLDTSAVLSVETIPTSPGIEKPKTQQQQNSRPSSRKTVSQHPKQLNRQLKPRQRFISGQGKTLDNGIRLWEADNVTGEPKIYY